MDLLDLRIFHDLYLEQNLTLVSKRLHLSQPTVSYRLNKIQEELGKPLYHFDGSYQFNSKAVQFFNYCRRSLEGYDALKESFARDNRYEVHLSAVAGYEYLSVIYQSLENAGVYPVIRITNSEIALSQVIEGQANLAIVGGLNRAIPRNLILQPLQEDKVILMYNASLPDDVSCIPLLVDEPHSGLRVLTDQYLETLAEKGSALPAVVGEIGSSFEKILIAKEKPVGFFIPQAYLSLIKYNRELIKTAEQYAFSRKVYAVYPRKLKGDPVLKTLIPLLRAASHQVS